MHPVNYSYILVTCMRNTHPYTDIYRLKVYVAKKSITPEIDDSYITTAHNYKSWSRALKIHHNQIVKIVYCTPTLAVLSLLYWYLCLLVQRLGAAAVD